MSFDYEQSKSREMEEELSMPEVSEAIKATFVRLKRPVVLGCGDDRGCLEKSARQLTESGLPMDYAFARGLRYYDSDVVLITETLLRSFPELDLDPRVLLDVMMFDEAATRLALAAGDGAADPQRIRTQRYGDGRQALEYLSSI